MECCGKKLIILDVQLALTKKAYWSYTHSHDSTRPYALTWTEILW